MFSCSKTSSAIRGPRSRYPIGGGVVEGACRHLVKDRMELTGMRWQTDDAQAMLDLRSVFLNDDWEAFQQYRIYPSIQ